LIASIENPYTGKKMSVNMKIKDSECCICETQITEAQKYIRCKQCERKLHIKTDCEFSVVQFDYANNTYCSLSCYLNQENYEVEIVNENTLSKKYLMKYKNGEKGWISKKQVETTAQYAKILHDWRVTHPPMQVYIEDDDDIELIENKMNETNMENTKDGGDMNKCCVCQETLTNENPHTCHVCKRRMHGHIICPRHELIYCDDDKLYCGECKRN
jgi:hypothetical protein